MEKNKRPNITNYPQKAIRNRAKQGAYIRNGAARLITSPPTGILALLLPMVGIMVAWNMAAAFAAHMTTIPTLVPVLAYTLRISLVLVVVLLFTGFLSLLGTPRKAREIENDLAAAFGLVRSSPLYYRCPFLVAHKPLKGTTATEYVFWARWIDLDQWNKPETKKAVLWALNAHSDENFTHGKKKYTVSIHAGSGAKPEERESPLDPLFK